MSLAWPSFLACDMHTCPERRLWGLAHPHFARRIEGAQWWEPGLPSSFKGSFTDLANNSKLPKFAPRLRLPPPWDSGRETYQGVELLEPECDLFFFNPFLRGPGDSPKPLGVG